jgi:hypothetical protein
MPGVRRRQCGMPAPLQNQRNTPWYCIKSRAARPGRATLAHQQPWLPARHPCCQGGQSACSARHPPRACHHPSTIADACPLFLPRPECDPHAVTKHCDSVLGGGHISQSLALFGPGPSASGSQGRRMDYVQDPKYMTRWEWLLYYNSQGGAWGHISGPRQTHERRSGPGDRDSTELLH